MLLYANNFTMENIKEAINYAHKRNVKVFITLNILIKDEELNEVKKYINDLYLLGVDGIIVQDYAVMNYIKDNKTEFIQFIDVLYLHIVFKLMLSNNQTNCNHFCNILCILIQF